MTDAKAARRAKFAEGLNKLRKEVEAQRRKEVYLTEMVASGDRSRSEELPVPFADKVKKLATLHERVALAKELEEDLDLVEDLAEAKEVDLTMEVMKTALQKKRQLEGK